MNLLNIENNYIHTVEIELEKTEFIPRIFEFDNVVNNEINQNIKINYCEIDQFCDLNNISRKDYFTSVFSLTLSCFAGQSKVFFYTYNNKSTKVPFFISCSFDKTFDFVKIIKETLIKSDTQNESADNLSDKLSNIQNIYFRFGNNCKHPSDKNSLSLIIDDNNDLLSINNNMFANDDFPQIFLDVFVSVCESLAKEKLLKNINFVNYVPNRNETAYDYIDVYNAFVSNVNCCPDHLFLQSGDEKLSYKQACARVLSLQRELSAAGVKEGDTVALMLKRSTRFMTSMLAILGLGAAYVPIDDKHPNQYSSDIINDASCDVIVTDSKYLNRVSQFAKDNTVINIDEITDNQTLTLKTINYQKNLTACILFTSGSTGKPKGVCISRDGIANLSRWLASFAELEEGDIFGMAQSLGFSAHIEVMFSALYAKSAVDILPEEYRYQPDKINSYIAKNKVTCIKLPSPLGREFINSIKQTNLLFLLLSGAQLGQVEVDRSYRIVDEYGSTENTAQASAIDVKNKQRVESIGFPIWNTELIVADNNLRILPPYAKGYLYTAGRGVSNGYLNNEKMTKDAFLPNPYCDTWPFDRLYKTGDCAYWLPNHEVCYLGRDDNQVKISGCRIELSEIENCIRSIDNIKEVAVLAKKKDSDYFLVAYVQTDFNKDDAQSIVIDYVGANKPKYMVPSFVIPIEKIPLNVNGKVDRKALSVLEIEVEHNDYVAPQTEDQQILCRTFEEVLDVDRVGLDDDFIKLGGDSLSAIKIVGRLKNLSLSIADIINYRTPNRILKKCQDKSKNINLDKVDNLAKKYFEECQKEYENTGHYKCDLTKAQYNIYIVDSMQDSSNSFNQEICVEIDKNLAFEKIESAVNALCDKYPILKSRITSIESAPKLVCDSFLSIKRVSSDTLANKNVRNIISEKIDISMNMGRVVVVTTPNKRYVIFSLHHIITDFSSNGVLSKSFLNIVNNNFTFDADLGFLYQSCYDKAYKEVYLDNPANKYFEEMFSSAEIESSVKLPYDTYFDNDSEYVKMTFIKGSFKIDKLNSFCKNNGITVGSYLTAAFGLCLSKFSFEKTVEFSVLDFGRYLPNVEQSIGYFVNTIPYLCDCSSNHSIEFLKTNSKTYFECLKNHDLNFQEVAKQFNLKHDIEFTFNTSKINTESVNIGEELEIIEVKSLNPSSDLVISAFNHNNTICVSGEFSSKYSDEYIVRFMHSYLQFINQLMSVQDIGEINYTTGLDIKTLKDINTNYVNLNYHDVTDGFINSIEKYPENTLVSYEEFEFSYLQSVCVINRIQALIDSNNLGTQSVIAVLVPRSHWYFFCAISCLCSDCVYVPIDDTYPDERISFMLKDSESNGIFVTEKTQARVNDILIQYNIDIKVLNVDGLDTNISLDDNLSFAECSQQDPACILYTSGSTGKPKGNVFTRLSLVNLNEWYVRHSNISSNSVYAQYSSFVFDMHTYAFFSVVLVGGCVTIVPSRARLDMPALANYFKEKNVTHTAMPTQVGKLFLQAGVPDCVENFALAGEALGDINASRLNFVLEDFYGPTESNVVTGCRVKDKIVSSSIGWLVDNVGAYILDNNKQLVPFGAVGELYLTGKQLVKGYLNRPEQNNDCFVNNPYNFDNNPDRVRMYKTGDIARFLPDNSIEYFGRVDGQVKIRGNRVELSEVESCIRQLDCVKDATVLAVENGTNKELVAYVVPSATSQYGKVQVDIPQGDNNSVSKNCTNTIIHTDDFLGKNVEKYQALLAKSESILEFNPGITHNYDKFELSIPISNIQDFCNIINVELSNYIASVFSFCASRFIFSDKVFVDYALVNDNVSIIPFIADCANITIESYIKNLQNNISSSYNFSEDEFTSAYKEIKKCADFSLVVFDRRQTYNSYSFDRNMGHKIICVVFLEKDDIKICIKSNGVSDIIFSNFCSVYNNLIIGFTKYPTLKDILYLDRNQVDFIDACNKTETDVDNKSIIEIFEHHLRLNNNELFVSDEKVEFNYGQSASLISALSEMVLSGGVDKGSNIAVFVNRSVWFVLCALGALISDCTYVPIDTSYPHSRVKFILEDINAKAIFVDNENLQEYREISTSLSICPKILNVDTINIDDIKQIDSLPQLDRNNQVACILYTSGTTGESKGSLIKNTSIVNFSTWMKSESKMKNGIRFGMYSSFVFDAHFIAFYPTILCGGTIYIIPDKVKHNLISLSKYFKQNNITHTFLTAQVAKTFISFNKQSSLDCLITGGEAVGDIDDDLSYLVIDAYGPTECCVATNCIKANKKINGISVGNFMPNCKGYILDTNQNLAPVGAVGELFLSGIQSIDGYLNRPEADKLSFFENRFCEDNNYSRIYKTCDLFQYLPDGTIGFIGREDCQVKIRGNRVELAEVEHVIKQIENIESVVATTIKQGTNNILVAYVVCNRKANSKFASEIKDYVSQHKPDYMIPSYIEFIDAIPLNINGKIDYTKLSKPDIFADKAEYVAPVNSLQKEICLAFESVLDVNKIGLDDDFIALGGDSLSAIKLLAHLNSDSINMADIFRYKTPRRISNYIISSQSSLDLQLYSQSKYIPLSEPQLNVYLDIIANNKKDAYIASFKIGIDQKYCKTEVRAALHKLLEAFPVLCSRVVQIDGNPCMVADVDKSALIIEENFSEIDKFYADEIDCSQQVCKFGFIVKDATLTLLCCFHHIAFDGISEVVFKAALNRLLKSNEFDKDLGYARNSSFYAQVAETKMYKNAKEYFDNQLKHLVFNPKEINKPKKNSSCIIKSNLNVDKFLIVSRAKETSTTLNSIFVSAFAKTLSLLSEREYTAFNVLHHGRDYSHSFNSVGMFVNTIPIVCKCSNEDTKKFIVANFNNLLEATSNSFYPYRKLTSKYDINMSLHFQYVPNIAPLVFCEEETENLQRRDFVSDIAFEVFELEDNFGLEITSSGKYSLGFCRCLIDCYKSVVSHICSNKFFDDNMLLNLVEKNTLKNNLDDKDNISKEVLNFDLTCLLNPDTSQVSEVASIQIEDDVKEFVGANKPRYMVPSYVVVLDSIPLNVNGKVDKRALPKPSFNYQNKQLVKPANKQEQKMVNCVSNTLNVVPDIVGVNTDLKSLGLDSLSAIMLSIRYEDELGYKLGASSILKHPQIAQQINLLDNKPKTSLIYRFHTVDDSETLYFVHPGQGGAESYGNLAEQLKNEVSFSCFDFYNLYHIEDQVRGIKNIAQLYVEELLKHDNSGLYNLGGWSYGGQIAYEMACILLKKNKLINNLFLLDSYNYEPDKSEDYMDEGYKRIVQHSAFKDEDDKIENVYSSLLKGIMQDQIEYNPSKYEGRAILFKSNKNDTTDNYYGDFVDELKIIRLDCRHWDLMENDNVSFISKEIIKEMSL